MSLPIKLTIRKDVQIDGKQFYAGSWIEVYPGQNIGETRLQDLLEAGAIELGVNEEFIKQKGAENAAKNLADRKDSD